MNLLLVLLACCRAFGRSCLRSYTQQLYSSGTGGRSQNAAEPINPISSPDQPAKITPRRNFSGCSARSLASDAACSITHATPDALSSAPGWILFSSPARSQRTTAAVAEVVVMCADQYVFVTAGLRRGRNVARLTLASFFCKCSTPQASFAFTFGNSNVVLTCGFSLIERRL